MSRKDLARALMREASEPCEGRGGWQCRIRRQQELMKKAADLLAPPTRARKATTPDLFTGAKLAPLMGDTHHG